VKSADLDAPILPENRSFYESALSIIATVLPSEKRPFGTVSDGTITPEFIDLRCIPVQK
jgi:hypothetical protein